MTVTGEYLWYIPNENVAGHRGANASRDHNSLDTLTAQTIALERHGWKGTQLLPLLRAGVATPEPVA